MNFFQRQTESRRLSRRLVALFALAVLIVVVVVDAVLFTALASMQPDSQGLMLPTREWLVAHAGVVIVTTLSVIGVIGLSSLYKTLTLSGGGGVVARSLGGVRVSAETTDPLQRRLLNVVGEMAIASGVPMPEVYLLEQEEGINAFAAGHNPANAAIAVTRGALTTLNRAELQGVIAHEFSHILNGDMQLNMRLMGLLFGLLVIALIARTVVNFAPRRGSGKKDRGAGFLLIAAVVVMIVGYIGLFFGRLIQAAVSRSRESLADASAVQFTRDPSGLRGALVKIGASAAGARIANPEAEEVAHMLFAPSASRMFATHPSLEERLKTIDPRFDKREFEEMSARLAAQRAAAAEPVREETLARKLGPLIAMPTAAGALTQLIANPGTLHIEAAHEIQESLPEALVVAGRHPASARALFLALALDAQPQARERQRTFIARQIGVQVEQAMSALLPEVDALQPQQRMPLLMQAFPALRQLTREERIRLMAGLNGMLQREGTMSLQAYVLRKLAQVHLRDDLDPRGRVGRLKLSEATVDLQVLFSVLAHHGHQEEAAARGAYEAGLNHLLPQERPPYSLTPRWPSQLDQALSHLDQLVPAGKEQLIEALARTIGHDARFTVAEAELLRTVCAALHCPLPPLQAAGRGL